MDFPTLGRFPDAVRWLGVDFFNTLCRIGFIDGPKTAWEVLRSFGIDVNINDLWPSYRKHEIDDQTGRITTNEKYARLLADLHLFSNTDPYANQQLILALRAAEKRDLMANGGVLEGAEEFLQWALSRNITLILVSNVTEVGTEVQRESGLMPYFDRLATSRNLGAVKSPEEMTLNLFEAFCWTYDLDPTAGVIVDDEERWLEVAHLAGLCTALLTLAWATDRTMTMQETFVPGIVAKDFLALQLELEAVV